MEEKRRETRRASGELQRKLTTFKIDPGPCSSYDDAAAAADDDDDDDDDDQLFSHESHF